MGIVIATLAAAFLAFVLGATIGYALGKTDGAAEVEEWHRMRRARR